MTAQFVANDIKLEGGDQPENVTEIQSYLEGFQKEIEGADGTVQQVAGIVKYIYFAWNITRK